MACNLNIAKNEIKEDKALADSGTTDHFPKEGAQADNIKVYRTPN